MKKIIVGMSGGVDSSVAAFLLKQQGYDVIGVFMKNWDDDVRNPVYRDLKTSGCTWEEDFADMRAVCQQLNIPYLTFNFVEEYRRTVFDLFLEELKAGRTPNPDIACNQEIKFRLFVQKALQLDGVDGVATGHYAKIVAGKLMRPVDRNKDQTYFLYRIEPSVLPRIVFPLQDLEKAEVRRIAQEQHFPNADKKDSTGICFIGNIDYDAFIDQYLPKQPGDIQTPDGTVIGQHEGLHFYTLGQRRGINIGGTGPYYVVAKDKKRNVLVVTNDADDERLFARECVVEDLHWLQSVKLPRECDVQIRYRQAPQRATLTSDANQRIQITFNEPQRAVTPGQAAVFYDRDTVLGGGVIFS